MSMRTIVFFLSTALFAVASSGQETLKRTPPPPDYSRPALNRIFLLDPPGDGPTPTIDTEVGAVRIRSRYSNFLLGYLPFFAPLPGSVPTTTRQMVDPFVMTGMAIPAGPRVMSRERARELRRIERLTRESSRTPDKTTATVTAKP